MSQPLTLPQLVTQFQSEAKEVPPLPDLDPNRIHAQVEALKNELEKSAADDETPKLQVVPRSANVKWIQLFALLLAESYRRVAAPGAKVPKAESEPGIAVAIEGAEGARRRLAQSIDGNKANPTLVAALRATIFAARTISATKAGWEAELRSCLAGIDALGTKAPAGVADMRELLTDALGKLEAAKPAATGRPAKEQVIWSQPVLEGSMALLLAMGALVSSAASKATDKRNAALQKYAFFNRREDAAPAAPKPEEKPVVAVDPKPADPRPANVSVTPAPATPGPVASGTTARADGAVVVAPVAAAPEATKSI